MTRMTSRRAGLIVGVAALVVAAGWWFTRAAPERVAIDLLKTYPGARRQPAERLFSVVDATVGGTAKSAIVTPDQSRITWPHVTIPEDGWLRVSLGIKENGWTTPGGGVQFFVIVSDGKTPEGVLTRQLNPFSVPSDRGWRDELVDLTSYGGATVDIIFNTRAGPRADTNEDLALWGAPQIVIR